MYPYAITIRAIGGVVLGAFVGMHSALAGEMIVPNGMTQTTVNTVGNVTDVRTQTINGVNAFNAFSKFDVHQGKTANLHVPGVAQNLLNLVYDKGTNIAGTLNAYKNGKIGGNVFFANPHGIVVSQGGVVNVGSFTASTPTKEFMDGFFDGPGRPNSTATQQLINGTAPLNSEARVDIHGQVNVQQSAQVSAGYIDVSGEINNVPAASLVNLKGQSSATEIVEKNGEIYLFAANDVDITGELHADGADNINAGDVDVRAGRDIKLSGQAQLTAAGQGENSDGGNVVVFADNDAAIHDDATLDASAGSSGNGGFVEFSSKKSLLINGGQFRAAASDGKNGSVLIDPEDLSVTSDTYTDGADYTLEAADSITVNAGVTISTRDLVDVDVEDHLTADSEGGSGDLMLTAPDITVKDGARLITFANNGKESGSIDLIAQKIDYVGTANIDIEDNVVMRSRAAGNSINGYINLYARGIASIANALVPVYDQKNTQASIDVGAATLDTGNLYINASADSQYSLEDGAVGANLAAGAIDFLGSINPLAGIAVSNADATVTIDGADIDATGSVEIGSEALAEAKSITPSMLIGVVYGRADTNAVTEIKGATTIDAIGDIDIKAKSDSDLSISAIVVTLAPTPSADVAIAYSTSNLNTLASVGSDVDIDSGGDVNVTADMKRSSFTTTTAMALEGGVAGLALSISDSTATTDAVIHGDVTAKGQVDVQASAETLRNETEASVTVGTSSLIGAVIYKATNALRNAAGLFSSSTSPVALAAGIAVANHENTASAEVSDSASIVARGMDSLYTDTSTKGDIKVDASIVDNVQTSANASIESTERNDKANSLSGAVNVANFTNTAVASIGAADIDAARDISVTSSVVKPYEVTWHQINSVRDVTDKLNPNLGIQNGFFTSWAGNKTTASGNAAGAAVNITTYNYNSTAKIDDNASINQNTAAVEPGFERDIKIDARSLVETVNLSGTWASAGDYNSPGGVSGGGAYLEVNYDIDTKASVGDSVTLDADSLAIHAETISRNVSIAGAGGGGGAVAVSGSTSNLNVDNDTRATIDNNAIVRLGSGSADISGYDPGKDGGFDPDYPLFLDSTGDGIVDSADDHVTSKDDLEYETDLALLVAAEDEAEIYNITGGVTISKNVGVGASVSVNNIARDTRAYIGDVDGSAHSAGSISAAGDALIAAFNAGDIYAYSLAGTKSALKAGGGAVANNVIGDIARSYIDNSNISGTGSASPALVVGNLSINSENNSYIEAVIDSVSVSGAASLGGSVAVNEISNDTDAYIKNVEYEELDKDTKIRAEDSSSILAVTNSVGASVALGAGAAVAVNRVDNSIDAYMSGVNTDFKARNIIIESMLDADINSTAVAAAGAGLVGVGGSISSNYIKNNINSYIDDGATIAAENNIGVLAIGDDRIKASSGGAGVGLAGGGIGVSFLVNEIGGNTKAYIADTGTNVTAYAKDDADALSISDGEPQSGVNLAEQ
ncbi:MAG: leukotoxin LktA family filamentous adhesin, partial [Gammaproteobacteria bacterium]|nr:leukotoxin LktA family filamentous adhesin [Gammaproteobacteria bacterium]